MRYTVTITLKSPALVGDRREPSAYFLPSRDFIPGAVLRAALARVITEGCPYYSQARLHWVRFANKPDCEGCRWRGLCTSFDSLRISHLYVEGARVAPLTAYRCKFNKNHPVFDTLFGLGNPRCPECNDRAERAGGYIDDHGQTVPVHRRLIMRLGVDPYRGVARDRQLFALRVLNEGQTFRGRLDIPDEVVEIPQDFTLRLGAKTTVGLGQATLYLERLEGSGSADLLERLTRFQEGAREWLERRGEKETGEYSYFSVTLLADALPAAALTAKVERVPTAILRQELAAALFPPESPLSTRDLDAVRVIADFRVYGGYCTAERGNGRREATLHIAAGSVFLYRVPGALNDGLLQALRLLEEQGVGARTEDGYGAACVCDEFHLSTGGMTGEHK
ncbi:MAG: hypothetical protein AB1426_09190 [Bacillota bacterium]